LGVFWRTLELDLAVADDDANVVRLAALEERDAWCLVLPGSVQRSQRSCA
jgi:hypothetical protein